MMLVLPPRLTHVEASACVGMLQQSFSSAPIGDSSTVIDATALTQFDSSAIAVLLEIRREAGAAGHGFAVRGLAPRLRELASLYGVAGLLPAAP